MINRIKTIINSDDLNDVNTLQQTTDAFEYFLNKLSSDKQSIRNGALKIFSKLFQTSNCILDRLQIPPLPGQQQQQLQYHHQVDLKQLLISFKQLPAYERCVRPLLIKYFRRAIFIETNPAHLNLYLYFLFKQILKDFKLVEASSKMDLDDTDNVDKFHEIATDFADFFFKRDYFLSTIQTFSKFKPSIDLNESSDQIEEMKNFSKFFQEFCTLILKHSQIEQNSHLIQTRQDFNRDNLDSNRYLLIENEITQPVFYYINEKLFNLIIYFVVLIKKIDEKKSIFCENFSNLKFLNCNFDQALNDLIKEKLLKASDVELNEYISGKCSKLDIRLTELLIESIGSNLSELFKILYEKYGLSLLSVYLIISKIEGRDIRQDINNFCNSIGVGLNKLADVIDCYIQSLRSAIDNKTFGSSLMEVLNNLRVDKPLFNGGDVEMSEELSRPAKARIFSFSRQETRSCLSIASSLTNDSILNTLNNIQSQIDCLKQENNRLRSEQSIEKMVVVGDEGSEGSEGKEDGNLILTPLVNIINESTNQNLETNLNRQLNDLSTQDRIVVLSESILNYELKKCKFVSNKNKIKSQVSNTHERCIIDIMLDYFCHFDAQIVSKQFDIEFRLLFEMRSHESSLSVTQPFLLSLFIHQANWQRLCDSVAFILKDHLFFRKHDKQYW